MKDIHADYVTVMHTKSCQIVSSRLYWKIYMIYDTDVNLITQLKNVRYTTVEDSIQERTSLVVADLHLIHLQTSTYAIVY